MLSKGGVGIDFDRPPSPTLAKSRALCLMDEILENKTAMIFFSKESRAFSSKGYKNWTVRDQIHTKY